MSRPSGDGRPPERSSFAENRPTATSPKIIPDTETTRGPFPGREDNGEEDDYSELLRAAWERLEPQVRSQKALLATPSMKGSAQVITYRPHHSGQHHNAASAHYNCCRLTPYNLRRAPSAARLPM